MYENNENEPTLATGIYYFMWEILLAIIMPHFGNIYTWSVRGYSLWLNINNWGSTVE